MENEHPWIKDAYRMAQGRHRGLKHPVSQKPWFEFIINVYFQIYKFSKDNHLRTAALLFDGLRNKLYTYNEIARRFDAEVADIVKEISFEEKDKLSTEQLKVFYKSKVRRLSKNGVMLMLAERLELVHQLMTSQQDNAADIFEEIFGFIDAIPKPLYTEYSLLIEAIVTAIQEYNDLPRE